MHSCGDLGVNWARARTLNLSRLCENRAFSVCCLLPCAVSQCATNTTAACSL